MLTSTRAIATLVFLIVLAACGAETGHDQTGPTNPNPLIPQVVTSTATSTQLATPPLPIGGGACDYRKYDGKCTVTENGTPPTFTFEGMVEGKTVKLDGNEIDPSTDHSLDIAKVGDSKSCTLQFISKGTCTPCVLSPGSCGKPAWTLFRSTTR